MTDDDIEQIVAEVLAAYDVASVPVDPKAIASHEKIRLLPGDYDNCFDGRLECRNEGGKTAFYLFYAKELAPARPASRVRFSIAHELGHFYLPRHREFLLSGACHSSHSDFVSDKSVEREADKFAASLLMPRAIFEEEVRSRSGGYCTLDDLIDMAEGIFKTSVTSTALRYTHLSFEPCCVVLSRGNDVLYSVRSDDMRERGYGYVPKGATLPAQSHTARRLVGGVGSPVARRTEGRIASAVWFESKRSVPLWEEAVLLGGTGLALTFLTPEDDGRDDD
jgi:hypothetical protein